MTDYEITLTPKRAKAVPVPDPSGTAPLVVEQAHALVQSDEARFAGAQTRATTLLAVGGVLAGLAANGIAGLDGRDYGSPISVFGAGIPLLLISVITLAVIASVSLVGSGAVALGALSQDAGSGSDSRKLSQVLDQQFPGLLGSQPQAAAQVLLTLLADQLADVQTANERMAKALRLSAILLGVAVVLGLALSVLVLLGSSPVHEPVNLIREATESSVTHRSTR